MKSLTFSLAAALTISAGAVRAADTINCVFPFWFGFAPVFVADKNGYFAEEDLTVTWAFDNDRANVLPGLETGAIDCTMRTIGESMARPRTPETTGTIIGTIDISIGADGVVAARGDLGERGGGAGGGVEARREAVGVAVALEVPRGGHVGSTAPHHEGQPAHLEGLVERQRALPIGYSKDLQEDKSAVFEAEDALAQMLEVAAAMLADVAFDGERMRAAVEDPSGYMLATEAADWLVRRGVSFREAHEAVGALVSEAERRGVALEALPLEAFTSAHTAFDATVFESLSIDAAVDGRTAVGGTGRANVASEAARWRGVLDAL